MKKPTSTLRRRLLLASLIIFSTILSVLAMIAPILQSSLRPIPKEGEIATQDFRAPAALSFTSEVLTDQRRETAERAVASIFTAPDTRIARRQLEQIRASLAFINTVRADAYSSAEQKLKDLSALDDISLQHATAEKILSMPDARWQEVQQEAIKVLEQAMSNTIRPESLVDARNRVPVLVSLALTEEQSIIVAELAAAYLAPNSEYSESLTIDARQDARAAVEPVVRSFAPGQTIVLQGELLTAVDIEALQQSGLSNAKSNSKELISSALLAILMVGFIALYIRRKNGLISGDLKKLSVLAILQILFILVARLVIPSNPTIVYAFPLASCALVTAALFGTELALITSIPVTMLAAFGLVNSLEIWAFFLITSAFGVLALGRARRMITFLRAGMAITIAGCLVILIFRLPLPSTTWINIAEIGAAAFLNGLISASLSILLHAVFAPILDLLTPMQLLDLTRPDHPLLSLLLRDAPGTYQHSLQVANLAEQAAENIGVDPLFIRAGALYHDIGKISNPAFYIENQLPGFENPHDSMDPVESAQVIITHVADGLKLAKKYRLPGRIQDFITEHHGTAITSYQYHNAVKNASNDESLVNKDAFRYPGPRPQSRETAMLMLADACEARMRAEHPSDDEGLIALIRSVISGRLASGQLDDTRLTMQDYYVIADSFATTLRGVYHPRLHYPNPELPAVSEEIALSTE